MPRFNPDNITVRDLIEGRDWWENYKKECEDRRDEYLGYMTQFIRDPLRRNKLIIMLYNIQNEIEEAENAVERLNEFIFEDLQS